MVLETGPGTVKESYFLILQQIIEGWEWGNAKKTYIIWERRITDRGDHYRLGEERSALTSWDESYEEMCRSCCQFGCWKFINSIEGWDGEVGKVVLKM